jgi:hypothetical protein
VKSIEEQIDWAADTTYDREESVSRLRTILTNPEQIGSRIISLMEELNSRAVHAYGMRGEYKSDLVRNKWKILDGVIQGRREELNKAGVMVFVGGSLLFQDPSDNPDYDVVVFSFDKSDETRRVATEIQEDLYEVDHEVSMVDVVPVNLESLGAMVSGWEGENQADDGEMGRMQLHYLNHVLTGFPLFTPDKFSQDMAEYLRNHLVCDYYIKHPVLGAATIVDLEGVLEVRKERLERR